LELSEKLRTLRETHGYMQKDVAAKLKIASNTISGYERGLRYPDSKTLKEIANYYGVTMDFLLSNEEPVEAKDNLTEWNDLFEHIKGKSKQEQIRIYKVISILLEY
jgi:transcriptional regulator with XRE-family HTH domain